MSEFDIETVRRCAHETRFSGVVRVTVGGHVLMDDPFGLADRRHQLAVTTNTQFALASGTKTFTALTMMSLVDAGEIRPDTTARSLLGDDLPLIDDGVTVEHLLSHRSGIGDYYDESIHQDRATYIMTLPVHRYATTDGYLPELGDHPQVSPPGERFAYNNGGFVVLAVLIERATGRSFHSLVAERVLDPAGMTRTGFFRADDLPADAAIGYLSLDDDRTNVLHLPIVGSGDGGIYSTVDDIHRLWSAFGHGTIVSPGAIDAMTTRRSLTASGDDAYGLGIWLSPTEDWLHMEGSDAGVSFVSRHDRSSATTWTVISNTTDGAWPLVRVLSDAAVS